MKCHALISSLFAVLLAACAVPPPRPPPAVGPPGTLTVQVQDHLAWPYTLERVIAVVDGSVLLDRSGPLRGHAWTKRIQFLLGEHVVQTLVEASYASGTLGEGCHTTLRLHRTYRLGAVGASLVMDVHLGSAWRDFGKRLDIKYVTHGLRPPYDESGWPPDGDEAECAQPGLVPATLCRADVLVAEARRWHEATRLDCYVHARSALRRAASAGGPGVNQRIAELWDELEKCGGNEVGILFQTGHETNPACTAPAPLPGLAGFDDPSPLLGW